ncbi:hypothetical protein SAMN03159341_101780 [Paenibacillus sp. 1_12]|nr:hypothetical protein SAMN03159341_101780 [Paenibacillus sp. 1_12]
MTSHTNLDLTRIQHELSEKCTRRTAKGWHKQLFLIFKSQDIRTDLEKITFRSTFTLDQKVIYILWDKLHHSATLMRSFPIVQL